MPPKRRGRRGQKATPVAKQTSPIPTVPPIPPKSALAVLPPEIWRIVGEYIRGASTLKALRLVCRDFHALYSRALFETRSYRLEKVDPKRPRYMSLPPGLEHVRELRALIEEFPGNPWRPGKKWHDPKRNYNYSRYLTRLLQATPNLESFMWFDQAMLEYSGGEIVNTPTVLKALSTAKNLKELYISFESTFVYENDPDAYRSHISLIRFSNLTSLEIYNFCGMPEDFIIVGLALTLQGNPSLKRLGLGLATDADCDTDPETVIIDSSDFLEKLCYTYGQINNRCPLSLDTLKLGRGLCVFEPESEYSGNYLRYLFKPQTLRTLHMFNGMLLINDGWTVDSMMRVDWSLLEDCTSLRQIAVTRLNRSLVGFLNTVASDVEEVIFADRYGMDGTGQKNLPRLDHALKTIFAFEQEYYGGHRANSEYWDPDSESDSDDSMDSLDHLGMCMTCGVSHAHPIEEDRPSSAEPRSTSLESLDSVEGRNTRSGRSRRGLVTNFVPEHVATVLDHLRDNGKDLEQLAISIDLEVQWEHFTTRLKALKKLTHVHLQQRTWKFGAWPQSRLSLWPKVSKAREIGLRYAELIKQVCPTVRFIRMGDYAWEAIPQRDLKKIKARDPKTRYELLRMTWDEIYEHDILAFDHVNTQCGLPLKEPRQSGSLEHLTDEEQDAYWDRLGKYTARAMLSAPVQSAISNAA